MTGEHSKPGVLSSDLDCTKCGRPLDEHAGMGLPCPMTQNRFGPKRLSPHAAFINSKHRLDYAISDLVKEFCEHHDLQASQIELVVTAAGCYAKVTL